MHRRIIVVLPAFNEEANIGRLLARLDETLKAFSMPYGAIVVDDGSADRTFEILQGSVKRFPLTLYHHSVNRGLAATICDGLQLACQNAGDDDVVITMDADESHPPELIPNMACKVWAGCDVVIASRYERGGRVHGVPLLRCMMSLGASFLFRLLFPTPGVRDFTCGYRAYRGSVLRAAFSRYGNRLIDQDGFQCMADILLKLRQMQVSFGEVPLVLRYDLKKSKSKIKVVRTVRQTLVLLIRRRTGL